MSGERQEPRAQLSFESIHDRKDRDQRGDSRQIPARETQLMKDTKYWCWRART